MLHLFGKHRQTAGKLVYSLCLLSAGLFAKAEINRFVPYSLHLACELSRIVPDTLPSYFNNSEYQTAIRRALYFQMQADSFQRVTEAQNATLSDAPENQKAGIKIAIRDSNDRAAALQNRANEWFARVNEYEVTSVKPNTGIKPKDETVSIEKTETSDNRLPQANTNKKSDAEKSSMEEFAILAKSPYSPANPIPVDQPLPDGVVYKIQLGAFGKTVPVNIFKGLTPISGEKTASGVTKYYTGFFRQYENADAALRKVHEYGYKEAYIVAFYNKKAIAPDRAKQLENK